MRIRIGGRGSKLSLIQMREVYNLIKSKFPHIDAEFIRIKTSGDINRSNPLYKMKVRGLFEKEVNKALDDGHIDIAVHSAKDVLFDTLKYDGFYPCVPLRRSRADAFVSRSGMSLLDIPSNSLIGSSSLRRISFIKYFRKDLRVKNIRGNVDTRLKKVFDGEYDGVVLAEAALSRLRFDIKYERLPVNEFVPAAGQGALIVLVKKGSEYEDLVRKINSDRFFAEVMVEKMIVWLLGGGCNIPLGVTCSYNYTNELLEIFAAIVDSQCSVKSVFRRVYNLPNVYATNMNRLRRIALDFYKYFLENGGETLIEGWLNVDD